MSRGFLCLVLTAVFSLQIFDIPPMARQANPKTCCGRKICSCSHAPGARCPVKHQAAMKKSHCHLPAAKTKTPETLVKLPRGGVVLEKSPCAKDAAPKTVAPGRFRDFDFAPKYIPYLVLLRDRAPQVLFHPSISPEPPGIDHPPRFFSSF